ERYRQQCLPCYQNFLSRIKCCILKIMKMKYIKICLLVALSLSLVQCSDDFLNKTQPDTINTDNYPTNADELITLVNGAYQPLQWPKLYNMRMWTTDIVAGNSVVGAGGGEDGIETTNLAN